MTSAVVAAIAVGLFVLAVRPPGGARLRGRDRAPAGLDGGATATRRVLASAACGVAAWFALSSLGPLSLALAAAAAVASYVVLGQLRSAEVTRRQAALTADLPQVCDLLVACLEAGLPLRVAADVVAAGLEGPLASRLAEAVARTSLGMAEERAWDELGTDPALAGLARELARGTGSGTALAARLGALGLDARREAFAQAESRAKKVGVQSVLPLMVCFLPAFLLLGVLPIVGGLVMQFFSK